ncbi:MAG TPA: hypothetical protein VIT43_07910 [Candidatus Dormibacteraeota bacterium]
MVSTDQLPAYYRTGLIEAVLLLLLFLVAFWAVTLVARDRWLRLGSSESLLARLAVAGLLGCISVSGLSGVVLNLLQGAAFTDPSLSVTTSRNQAVLGIALALAVTVVGTIRIEMYHRALAIPPVEEDEADWKIEPPEAAGGR